MPALAKRAALTGDSAGSGALARSLGVDAGAAAILVACYVSLDWASNIYPLGPFNITPWNPPPALAIVWMLLGGLRFAPVVFVSAFAADIFIRGAPGGLVVSALTSVVLAAGYTGMTAVLRRFLPGGAHLRDTHDLWIFVVVTAVGSALVALFYAGTLSATNYLESGAFLSAVFRSWLGDTVGILVTAPLLLVAAAPQERRRLVRALKKPETWLQLAVMVAVVTIIFRGEGASPTTYFYVLFLPLVWVALRNGFVGATLCTGVVQIGVVLGVQIGDLQVLDVLELQARVAALTLTGLFLGVMVDERERATEGLKRSLRLAASGEMAGAIAHEINQPLAALGNYGKACLLMLEREAPGRSDSALGKVIVKMQEESRRAAEVVVRLRDFFRSGTTKLERVSAQSLLAGVERLGEDLNTSREVAFRVEPAPDIILLIDRLQIELVLRNLVANAFEAVAHVPAERRRVNVSARRIQDGRVLFRVEDTGPGVPLSTRERLFEPMASNKALGMGLGLAISRTIAEAHGGGLGAPPADHGEFHLLLPAADADE